MSADQGKGRLAWFWVIVILLTLMSAYAAWAVAGWNTPLVGEVRTPRPLNLKPGGQAWIEGSCRYRGGVSVSPRMKRGVVILNISEREGTGAWRKAHSQSVEVTDSKWNCDINPNFASNTPTFPITFKISLCPATPPPWWERFRPFRDCAYVTIDNPKEQPRLNLDPP
jgi:hypothetical protein